MNPHVIRAIFKRNFISYFSNPTGYVFITVFVLISSYAAFWPAEFFNANLANLDQLNRWLPLIMLIFIPAISMSIWAEERRQGTDELLLTIPAEDFDVVIGKYLAGVAIFTVSLLFSLLCNFIVLTSLGSPDLGLFLSNYFGYWMVGLAMLAVGMVASFLTSNLTVSFVLGVLFNLPFAISAYADLFVSDSDAVAAVKKWSLLGQFQDFARGVVSLSGFCYFATIVAVMLYASMALIGRRHWRGGADGRRMAVHYGVRFASLIVAIAGLNVFLSHHNRVRADLTQEGLSSLAPETRQLLQQLDNKRPVHVDAYVSETVPEEYLKLKLDLETMLREFQAISRDKVQVRLHQINPSDKQAAQAEQQFGIKPQQVSARTRGAVSRQEIFMGVAFTCGLEKVVVPFLSKGIPVEYELIRSVATVSQQKRKKLGVLQTDAKLFGGMDFQTMSSSPNEQIIEELQKQYEVVQVDPTNPITEKFDVLLAVQPSSLGPPQMENFINAVSQGQPTAIFEDPFPLRPGVPGTLDPKEAGGGAMGMMGMGMRQPPQPKGDISRLWKTLGVKFDAANVVWQEFNPYPKLANVPNEFLFIGNGCGARRPFNTDDEITSGLQMVAFLFAGSLTKEGKDLEFAELATTGRKTGTVGQDKIMIRSPFGGRSLNPELGLEEVPKNKPFVVAAHIHGKLKPDQRKMSDKEAGSEDEPDAPQEPDSPKKGKKESAAKAKSSKKPADKSGEINVVLVADADCLSSDFFFIRSQGKDDREDSIDLELDNVTFVLNTLDLLAGDDRFVKIRKRRPTHRGLTKLDDKTEEYRKQAEQIRKDEKKKFEDARKQAQSEFDKQLREVSKNSNQNQQIAVIRMNAEQRLKTKEEQLMRERNEKLKSSERELAREIRQTQDFYKMSALMLPPIPPLLLAFFVFFNRRAREREGVSKSRLR